MANRPIYPATVQNAGLDVENGDGTGTQDLVTAGASGCRIDSISVTSDDTTDIDLIVYYYDGATAFAIARVTIPDGSGTNGTDPPVSLLNSTDMPFLDSSLSYYLSATDKIQIAAQTAVTAAKKISLVATYGDY